MTNRIKDVYRLISFYEERKGCYRYMLKRVCGVKELNGSIVEGVVFCETEKEAIKKIHHDIENTNEYISSNLYDLPVSPEKIPVDDIGLQEAIRHTPSPTED